MEGRVTIRTEEPVGLFFTSRCELNINAGKAEIIFEETVSRTNYLTQIGVAANKLIILREPLTAGEKQFSMKDARVFIISEESFRTSRATMEINDMMDLVLLAEGMKVRVAGKRVTIQLKCFFGTEGRKTDELTLHLVAEAIKQDEE